MQIESDPIGPYPAADSILRRAIRITERQFGRESQNVRELYGWLAELYDA